MNRSQYILLLILTLFVNCANQTTPTGGPKDEEPPVLINSTPKNNQKNFTGRTIELTFNEDVKLKDPKEEIMVSPDIGKNTKHTARRNKVIIEPELSWKENTTYSFSFREGIQDITESNPAEDLRLAFSTGPVIDSLSIYGNVRNMFSEKIPDKITIGLYETDTFNIYEHSPTYFTKSNKKGVFVLPNLKSGKYFIYAFEDKNKNLKVESKSEKFAFQVTPIDLRGPIDSVTLNLIAVDARIPAITTVRHTNATSLIRFNKAIDSLSVSLPNSTSSIYTFGDNQSELIFYKNFPKSDSIRISIYAQDSLRQKLDTAVYLKYTETKMAKESFKSKELAFNYNPITRELQLVISINKLLAKINPDSIYIKVDSLHSIPSLPKAISYDTINHTLTYRQILTLRPDSTNSSNKKKNTPKLIYSKGAIISIDADTLSRITKEINIPKDEDTGTVAIEIETTQNNYIIHLLKSDNTIIQTTKNIKTHIFKFLQPQDYKIQIHIDSNNNGRWDPGNFMLGIEPEKIFYYKSEEGKYTFPIRANWEYGPLLIKF